ncbi:MAG: chromosome segregation protein SMC [Clostridiales bacterium]|nr:chromosome segregation protein SMC [Clostridiales bacterium]
MYLKKLELQGFKSFPEHTVVEFGPGMTAVVGPNGSGKSNITDAVRWVLGEMSVKTLRGGKMEDVIFNGTSARKAMNYAEVTLVLDNSDRRVDLEFPEIQITRRLYRSGESEYQINKVNCRLKDITGLFLDTGLGKDGYSIVGQGRVDEVLSSKSEDRRRIVEEASGIVKFKMRKEEAERKLNSTENNLIRLNDIIGEIESRIEPLGEQAEKARTYHKTYDELKTKEISLLCAKIGNAQDAMGDSSQVKETLESDIAAKEAEFEALRNSNKEFTDRSDAIEEKIEDLRQELSDITEEEYGLVADQKVAGQKIISAQEALKTNEESLAELNKAAEDLAAVREDHKTKAAKLLDEATALKEQGEQFVKDKEDLEKELADKEDSFRSVNETIQGKTDELFEVKRNILAAKGKVEGFDERISEVQGKLKEIKESKKGSDEELAKADKYWHDMISGEKDVKSDISQRDEKMAELKVKQNELNKFFDENNRRLVALEARLKSLKDLESRKDGYQESVKKLSDKAKEDKEVSERIVGIIGDLINVDAKYEVAIETALGNSIHNVVTETEDDASYLINVLKDHKLGRITFLPKENIRPRDIAPEVKKKASSCAGYIGIASELVKCDPELKDIISNLLGRIIISETLDDARDIARKIEHSSKVICIDGDAVNPGGSLTGGYFKNSGIGILGRSREIEELAKKVETLDNKLADSEQDRQEIDDKLGTVTIELEQLAEQLKFYSVERVKAESAYRNLEEKTKGIEDEICALEQSLSDMSKEKIKTQEDIEEYESIETELEDSLAGFKETIAKRDEINEEYKAKIDSVRDKEAEITAKAAQLLAERNGVLDLASHIKGQIEDTNNAIKAKVDEIAECNKRIKEAEEESAAIDKKIAKFKESEGKLEAKIAELFEEKEKVSAEMSGFVDRITQVSDVINNLRNKLSAHVSKYEKYINDIDDAKNRLWENYEVTYDNVKEDAEPVKDLGKVNREVTQLRNIIRDLGPVNLNSIEEYDQVSKRYEFMVSQREDILTSKKELEKLIEELITEMRAQFIEHFNTINENFKVVFADLFGGGTAEILLDNDEDVLNCAIEIKAQPPGKKLQNLSLLSGGERCLTAIAFLFAILELKPSPFVILDEVEAALDDVNIVRFTDFVRRYTAKTQFVLVTHRKGTMEACDRMYGVTMAERGISKILSMELGS